MEPDSHQESFELSRKEILEFSHPLYFKKEKTEIGIISQLALEPGDWTFTAVHVRDQLYTASHDSGVSFLAELKDGRGKKKGTYEIKGCVQNPKENGQSFFDGVNIHSAGNSRWRLRPAQLGAVYSLMAHWSLTNEVATVVLPTGTGKTEAMLVATLLDRAERTLVIVPTIDLKGQIAEKFATWGLLRKLGVITNSAPNPTVLVLNKTLEKLTHIEIIERADIVISTPALLARATAEIKNKFSNLFSHVYFDEAHHVVAREWDTLKLLFKDSKIAQFTATPYRYDRQPIEGKVVYNYPLSQALRDKCFSRISLVTVDERHPKKKDKAIADAAMERLLHDRKKGWIRHRMMVRAEDKTQAVRLFQNYKQWFPKERIVLVHSRTKKRKSIIQKIKNGDYDIVVCVDMFKEGFDYPDLKIAAVHAIHKSLAVILQFIGRFTRTEEGVGDASFVVNYAEDKITVELESLLHQEKGEGWEEVISEIADTKKTEAESFLSFLQGCKPYSGFDSPDIELNPKLVYPALSCVCYHCKAVNWGRFKDAFNLKNYALSQPYINTKENVFYFTTQKREKVKWARTDKMQDQTWNLVIMHHDSSKNLLYVGYSEKRLDVNMLVEKLSGSYKTP